MKIPQKFSLSNFLLTCALALFVILYLHQRIQNESLAKRLNAAPLKNSIDNTKIAIKNKNLQLDKLLQKWKPRKDLLESLREPGASSKESSLQFTTAMRSELMNIRNLRLKIARDEKRLGNLETELQQMLPNEVE